jgi:glycosyltransferase involved in cell wall biosynthesis
MTQQVHRFWGERAEGDERIKVLFIGLEGMTFCRNDEVMLRKNFEVASIFLGPKYFLRFPLLFADMFRKLRKSDVAYVWFGDVWALATVFLAKLLGKKSIIVAGGYDVANEPAIDYGMLSRKFMRYVPIMAFRNCDTILAVSQFVKNELKGIVDNVAKVKVVYNGIDVSRFCGLGMERVLNTTIGNVTPRSYRVKGMEGFLNIVGECPEERFALVGRTDMGVNIERKENLDLPGYTSGDDLVHLLNRSKHYLQLSYRESFGIAVAEAMACGCVPIVTDRGGLPEVVGDAGHIVPYGDWDKVIEIISKGYDLQFGHAARDRVVRLFNEEIREGELVKAIEELVH